MGRWQHRHANGGKWIWLELRSPARGRRRCWLRDRMEGCSTSVTGEDDEEFSRRIIYEHIYSIFWISAN